MSDISNSTAAVLLNDYYKLTHVMQYSDDITQMTSYLAPRGSRLPGIEKMVFFGLSGFVHKLHAAYKETFFNVSWHIVEEQIRNALAGLGYGMKACNDVLMKFNTLHALGYLPIIIKGVPEGTLVPMGCPCIEITTTHPKLAWAGQLVEPMLSASIWHPCVSATIAREYRKIAEDAYEATVDNSGARYGMCDFSMRGQESVESAIASSAAWLAAMHNSSTVAAQHYIKAYYSDGKTIQAGGLTSTEHSVMTTWANRFPGGKEEDALDHLFDVYENASFSIVCDSYNFWKMATKTIPDKFKDQISERGKRGLFVGIRHDSADPVSALCGTVPLFVASSVEECDAECADGNSRFKVSIPIWGGITEFLEQITIQNHNEETGLLEVQVAISTMANGHLHHVFKGYSGIEVKGTLLLDVEKLKNTIVPDCVEGTFVCDITNSRAATRTYEEKGMVESLYEIYGGEVNSLGYKKLNPGIKAVYGDSITLTRAKKIYKQLKAKGFAANCVSLGVGSFSMQCMESEDGKLYPFTRDTFSIAIKCTHMRQKVILSNGSLAQIERAVFKDPIGFSGKKSHKGICHVWFNSDLQLEWSDGHTTLDETPRVDAFVPYFADGVVTQYKFAHVRQRVSNSLFL